MADVLISVILTAASVGYFIADQKGRLNGDYVGTGVIYLILPVIQCIAAGISTVVLLGTGGDNFIENVSLNDLICDILCILISLPGVIVSIVGAIKFIGRCRKSGYSDAHLKLSTIAAAMAIPVAIGSLIIAGIALFHILGAFALGFVVVIFGSLLAFCLGFIFVILLVPFFMAYVGLGLAMMYLPQILLLAVAAACFGTLYLIAAYGGISTAVSLCRNGEISKKRAVLYIVLSLFIFTDLYALSKMKRS